MGWTSVEPSAIRTLTTPPVHFVYGWRTSEEGSLTLAQCYDS